MTLRRAISGDGRNGDLRIDGRHIHDRTFDAGCDHRFRGALCGKETAGQIDVQDFLEIGRQCNAGVVNENRHIADIRLIFEKLLNLIARSVWIL